ncbi:MAG: hypothetical protein FWB88_09545 [Defluviitaleaceae bacterium]|nr:hypothetical protein [Defluviitaleaceae bacterium]MCL2239701.1 hypothetical protein [Defluviitaleaceae bacterium]
MDWRSTKAGDKAAHDAVMWLALRLRQKTNATTSAAKPMFPRQDEPPSHSPAPSHGDEKPVNSSAMGN